MVGKHHYDKMNIFLGDDVENGYVVIHRFMPPNAEPPAVPGHAMLLHEEGGSQTEDNGMQTEALLSQPHTYSHPLRSMKRTRLVRKNS